MLVMTADSRPLTPGEIALARTMFGDAIDYARVCLFNRKWRFFQPANSAMAPNGNIYFHPTSGLWSEDFSREPLGRRAFFIHEMTHVWQAQAKGRFYLPLMRHPFCRYGYVIKPGKAFSRYGIEQQAEIVARIFVAEQGGGGGSAPPRSLLPFG